MERRELLSTIFVSVSILLGLLSAKLLLLILPFYALFLRKTSGPIVFSFREWILLGVVSTYVAVGLIFSVFRFNSLSFAIDLLTFVANFRKIVTFLHFLKLKFYQTIYDIVF